MVIKIHQYKYRYWYNCLMKSRMTRSGSDFNFVSTSGGSSTTLMISLSQLLQITQSSVISVVEPLARRMKRYNFVRIFIVFCLSIYLSTGVGHVVEL